MATSHHSLDDLTNYDDHPQYLYLTGRNGGANILTYSSTTVTLAVTGAASQSGNLQEWRNNGGTALSYIDYAGVYHGAIVPDPTSFADYFYLPGRSGGQTAYGGTGASDQLTLRGNTIGTTNDWIKIPIFTASSSVTPDTARIFRIETSNAVNIFSVQGDGATTITAPYTTYTSGNPVLLTLDMPDNTSSGDTIFRIRTNNTIRYSVNWYGGTAITLGSNSVGFRVAGTSGQSAHLTDWTNNALTPLSFIGSDGKFDGSVAVSTGKTFQLVDGAASGYVLTSDGSGVASWGASIATLGVVDTTFTIHDDSIGSGRTARFEVASPAATEIVYTLPDSYTVEANTAPTLAVLEKAQVWTATQSFGDSVWRVYSNSSGPTAYSRFNMDSVIAGNVVTLVLQGSDNRTITFPDATTWLAGLSVANTWLADQTFNDGHLKLNGATSGALTLKAPAVASTYVATLPAATTTLAGLAVAQTFTASQTIAIAAGGGYLNLLDTGSGFKAILDMDSAPATQDLVFSLPVSVLDAAAVSSGTLAVYTGSSATLGQKFSTTGFDVDCGATCSTSSNGFFFHDITTTTKRLRFVLSGAVGNNNFVISTTAARAYKFDNHAGTVVTCGNTTAASGTLGVSNLTAQTGNIAATTLLTSSANSSGMFRVSFYLLTTTAGAGGDVVKVTVAYNDGAAQTADILLTDAIATPGAPAINHDLATLNKASYGSATIYCAASNAITFTTTVTKTGSPQYTLRARIEQLT